MEEGKGESGLRTGILMAAGLLCIFLLFLLFLHGKSVMIEKNVFTESNRELRNPNCGFYYIYRFMIQDEETDYEKLVKESYQNDTETTITLLQINLQNYRNGEISQRGLANIESLFRAMENIDKRLIVRFLYDWDGMASGQEPERLDIILLHMRQLEEILYRHRKQIFVMQGLFIGNWGEMNGTPYANSEDMRELAIALGQATDSSIYLSVRMPAQWRMIMQMKGVPEKTLPTDALSGRLGLFNDGMLGNESDYGTYGVASAEEAGVSSPWKREEELAFQEKLCRFVPNGGEVIVENAYNDLENARKYLALTHVTYLNRDYDQEVLNKWAGEVVREEGCFDKMDGLTYIQRHLGYRLLIADTDISQNFWKDSLSVEVKIKNIGFAPIYREPEIRLTICGGEERYTYLLNQPLKELAGGTQSEELLTLEEEIPLSGLSEKEYSLYLSIVDADTGKHILLANEQEEEEEGYLLGRVCFPGRRGMKENEKE